MLKEIAEQLLTLHPEIKTRLEQRTSEDTVFAKNGDAQLDFIYRNSPYYEPDHLRYPVYRMLR